MKTYRSTLRLAVFTATALISQAEVARENWTPGMSGISA